MSKLLVWISASFFFFGVAMVLDPAQAAQQSPTATKASNSASQNPSSETVASLARAKQVYGYDCSMCHGPMGRGKTDLGKDATGSVPDLTDAATMARLSATELYNIIMNGKGKMPGEKGRLNDDGVRGMMAYVRNLAKQETSIAGNSTSH
jgi:mono/diheme cytochrome c family protein